MYSFSTGEQFSVGFGNVELITERILSPAFWSTLPKNDNKVRGIEFSCILLIIAGFFTIIVSKLETAITSLFKEKLFFNPSISLYMAYENWVSCLFLNSYS